MTATLLVRTGLFAQLHIQSRTRTYTTLRYRATAYQVLGSIIVYYNSRIPLCRPQYQLPWYVYTDSLTSPCYAVLEACALMNDILAFCR